MNPETFIFGGAFVCIIAQLWQMNRTLGGINVKDEAQDKEIERQSRRLHDHAQVMQGHEGRITLLEFKHKES